MIAAPGEITFKEEGHTYWKDNVQVPGFHEVMDFVVPTNRFYKNPQYYQWRGRAVHSATQDIDAGNEISADPDVIPFLKAYQKFLDEHEVMWLFSEQVVFHPVLRYCGTLDRFGIVDGDEGILDVKCGVPDPHTPMQLCAYGMCLPSVPHNWVLYLREDETYKLVDVYDPSLPSVWTSITTVYWWRKR